MRASGRTTGGGDINLINKLAVAPAADGQNCPSKPVFFLKLGLFPAAGTQTNRRGGGEKRQLLLRMTRNDNKEKISAGRDHFQV